MVHKRKSKEKEWIDDYLDQMDKDYANQLKETEERLDKQQKEMEQFAEDIESTAKSTYKTVRGIYYKGKRTLRKGKQLGEKLWSKVKGQKPPKKRPIPVYVTPVKKDEVQYGEL
jgi:hypothetical protein